MTDLHKARWYAVCAACFYFAAVVVFWSVAPPPPAPRPVPPAAPADAVTLDGINAVLAALTMLLAAILHLLKSAEPFLVFLRYVTGNP